MFTEIIQIPITVLLSVLLQLCIHEFGHYLFGKATGYDMIFLRIWKIVFFVQNKKLRVKVLSSFSSAGQCLMYPTKGNTKQSDTLYNMGGSICNMVTMLFGVCIMFDNRNVESWMFGICLFLTGAVFTIYNLVDNNMQITDGAYQRLKMKDKMVNQIQNQQLLIAKELFSGHPYGRIDKKLFLSESQTDHDIVAYHKILESYYYMDQNDIMSAFRCIKEAEAYLNICDDTKECIKIEKKYLKLRNELKTGRLKKSYSVVDYFEETNIHAIRTNALIDYLRGITSEETSPKEILRIYKKRIVAMKELYDGEKEFCLRQLDRIEEDDTR